MSLPPEARQQQVLTNRDRYAPPIAITHMYLLKYVSPHYSMTGILPTSKTVQAFPVIIESPLPRLFLKTSLLSSCFSSGNILK